MAGIDFEPDKRTVEDLFVGADYYVIPRFQRPYSWDAANLDDFWRDVVYDNDIGYFIGPMVAWREPGSPIRRLVDGQQRITTIAIIFAVLRDQFSSLGEGNLAEGIHRYLEKADRNNELRFTLGTEVESPFLAQAIFKSPPDATVKPNSEEEAALSKALDAITRRVQEEVNKRVTPTEWLRDLRDRLLGLRVIWIEHSNEDDAYVIFETLNTRGKDLEVVDLVKNHLLNRLRGTGNAAADTARTTWDKMRNELEGSDTRKRIDPNRFMLHWWLSQEEYVAERKLFPAIKKKVATKSAAKTRLESLARDAPLYRAATEPASRIWPIEEEQARRSLAALAIFGVVQPAPLLLSLIRAREAPTKLNAAQFRSTLTVIERFHFQHTVVSQLRSSGGVSEMYAKAARELCAASDNQQKRADVLKDIRKKLIDRRPDRDQFILAFQERFYFTNEFTRDSKLVRYVLESFLRVAHPSTSTQNLTIEHVLPQKELVSGGSLQVVGAIGNLLLVNEDLNSKLDDADFSAKKAILQGEGAHYDIGGIWMLPIGLLHLFRHERRCSQGKPTTKSGNYEHGYLRMTA
ncbi:DUF262 domain-containing protein [Mycobacterium nebraskense]|uniref:DUF262 domain-containing protein n=1 Tax=Mycobacterium nebraskense TaxID=244292 RepID=UPI0009E1A842|nr:DUF262 domain-containing protein [Mycobacterium nebraskense]MCV7120525.1 DUF262 domain-containing protein [Mycobacterium nebraskense]